MRPDDVGASGGIIIPGNLACPPGFTAGETVIHRGIEPGACEGCTCMSDGSPAQCSATVWSYGSDAECQQDTGLTSGFRYPMPITFACTGDPIPVDFFSFGARAEITATGSCAPSGTPTPGMSTWTETVKFCEASDVGAGCATGQSCVRRAEATTAQCALAAGAAACDGFTMTQTDWYTGYTDQRTCGACSCESEGGCEAIQVEIGSDYTCGNFALVGDDMKNCYGQIYEPPARLVGAPQPVTTCNPSAPATGAIDPTGQHTLCCAP